MVATGATAVTVLPGAGEKSEKPICARFPRAGTDVRIRHGPRCPPYTPHKGRSTAGLRTIVTSERVSFSLQSARAHAHRRLGYLNTQPLLPCRGRRRVLQRRTRVAHTARHYATGCMDLTGNRTKVVCIFKTKIQRIAVLRNGRSEMRSPESGASECTLVLNPKPQRS